MNENDEILRYISDLMTDEEKKAFDAQLTGSVELSEKLEESRRKISNLKNLSSIVEHSPYFTNLLPRVRSRLDDKSPFITASRLAYILPVIVIIFSFILNYFDGRNNNFTPQPESFSLMISEAVDESNNESLTQILEEDIYFGLNDFPLSELDAEIQNGSYFDLNLGYQNYINNRDLPVLDELNYYDKFNDQDIEEVYKILLNKEIL